MKMKRNLIITACLTLLLSSIAFVLSLGGGGGKPNLVVHAAGGIPEIIAIAYVDGQPIDEYPDYPTLCGTLQIGNIQSSLRRYLKMNGNDIYSSLSATSTVDFTVAEGDHFEFTEFVIRKKTSNDVYDIDTTLLDGGISSNANTHFVLADEDYLIEVHFTLKKYDLHITAEYFTKNYNERGIDDVTAEIGDGVMIRTDINGDEINENESKIITLGSTVYLKNRITNNYDEAESDTNRYDLRFCYAEINFANSVYYDNCGLPTDVNPYDYAITFNALALAKYLESRAVNIVGVYVPKVKVLVTTPEVTVGYECIELVGISPVYIQAGGVVSKVFGAKEHYFDAGTELTVKPVGNPYFTFDSLEEITETATLDAIAPTTKKFDFNLNDENIEIAVNFIAEGFNLIISAVTGNNYTNVVLGNSVYTLVHDPKNANAVQSVNIKSGDILTGINFSGLAGYSYDGVSIKVGKNYFGEALQNATFSEGMIVINEDINSGFLKKYQYNGYVEIVIHLTKLYSLDIIVPNEIMGTVTTEVISGDKIGDFYTIGSKIKITTESEDYYSFSGFTGIFSDEREGGGWRETETGGEVIITVGLNRTININFATRDYVVQTGSSNYIIRTSSNDEENKNKFVVDDTVYITFDEVPENYVIKTLRINGHDYTTLGDNVKLNGNNTLEIHCTQTWLNNNKWFLTDEIRLEIEPKLKPALLLGFGIPGVLIPLAAIVLAIFMIKNNKRKKLIKGKLTAKMQRDITLSTGKFIGDLREGKTSGEVTKEDIKKAIKEEKQLKKETAKQQKAHKVEEKSVAIPSKGSVNVQKAGVEKTPDTSAQKKAQVIKTIYAVPATKPAVEPVRPVSSAPAKPAVAASSPVATSASLTPQQITALFDGSFLKPDMTFNKKNTMFATLQKDGTIVDRSKTVFAKARLQDSKITDLRNNVVGKIGSDGTITKP